MKLLALVDSPAHVCCRYRIRAFWAALEQSGWAVTYESLASGVIGRARQFMRSARYDAVLLQRKLLPGWQLARLRSAARRLIFDFDDAVLFRDSYDIRGIHGGRRLARFQRTVQVADAVIAGNNFLADCALRARAGASHVQVIPTCVEPNLYPISTQHPSTAAPDLVWIGSASTLQGLEQSRPIWAAVAAAVPDIRIRIICDRFPIDFPMPIVRVPWNEATEAVELSRAQIGVGWLPDDDWSRGKCGLKILQYQAAGLPVVANPVGSHTEMVADHDTGFLCSSPREWADAIARLAIDLPLRVQMGQRAREGVELQYSVNAWSQAFVDTIVGGTEPITDAPQARSQLWPRKPHAFHELNPIVGHR